MTKISLSVELAEWEQIWPFYPEATDPWVKLSAKFFRAFDPEISWWENPRTMMLEYRVRIQGDEKKFYISKIDLEVGGRSVEAHIANELYNVLHDEIISRLDQLSFDTYWD